MREACSAGYHLGVDRFCDRRLLMEEGVLIAYGTQ